MRGSVAIRAALALIQASLAGLSGYWALANLAPTSGGIFGLVMFGSIAYALATSAKLRSCPSCHLAFSASLEGDSLCERCADDEKLVAEKSRQEAQKDAAARAEESRQSMRQAETERLRLLDQQLAEEAGRFEEAETERLRLLDQQLTEEAGWFELSPQHFEREVARLFAGAGFDATVTKQTGDGGIDIELRRSGERRIVQCKRYKGTVSRPDLQRFYGVLVHEGVQRGYFVTTGTFSSGAIAFAKEKPIELIDMQRLREMKRGKVPIR